MVNFYVFFFGCIFSKSLFLRPRRCSRVVKIVALTLSTSYFRASCVLEGARRILSQAQCHLKTFNVFQAFSFSKSTYKVTAKHILRIFP